MTLDYDTPPFLFQIACIQRLPIIFELLNNILKKADCFQSMIFLCTALAVFFVYLLIDSRFVPFNFSVVQNYSSALDFVFNGIVCLA